MMQSQTLKPLKGNAMAFICWDTHYPYIIWTTVEQWLFSSKYSAWFLCWFLWRPTPGQELGQLSQTRAWTMVCPVYSYSCRTVSDFISCIL